ncbi:MAG: glycosyltransferase family 2 protein [Nanoarchaeota archaeon]
MKKKKVSVIAVCLNEAKSILKILDNIPKGFVDEILVVDGHSTDRTFELVKNLGYNIILQEGKGRGNAFRTGFKNVSGDLVVMLSTDGNERPADIKKLIDKINDGYDMVIATRFGLGNSEDVTFIRNIGNYFFTKLCNIFGGINITDSMNGFRILRKESIKKMNLEADKFDIEAEITLKAGKLKLKVGEIPTIEDERQHSTSRLRTIRDGSIILKRILKEAFRRPPY